MILEVNNLKKIYHTQDSEIEALENITFTVNEGEFIAIVGPSGCGKSTILSILCKTNTYPACEIFLNLI